MLSFPDVIVVLVYVELLDLVISQYTQVDQVVYTGMPHLIIAFFFLTLCLPLSFLPFTIHTLQIVIEHVTTNTADDTVIAIISSRESSKLELSSTVTEMNECTL